MEICKVFLRSGGGDVGGGGAGDGGLGGGGGSAGAGGLGRICAREKVEGLPSAMCRDSND